MADIDSTAAEMQVSLGLSQHAFDILMQANGQEPMEAARIIDQHMFAHQRRAGAVPRIHSFIEFAVAEGLETLVEDVLAGRTERVEADIQENLAYAEELKVLKERVQEVGVESILGQMVIHAQLKQMTPDHAEAEQAETLTVFDQDQGLPQLSPRNERRLIALETAEQGEDQDTIVQRVMSLFKPHNRPKTQTIENTLREMQRAIEILDDGESPDTTNPFIRDLVYIHDQLPSAFSLIRENLDNCFVRPNDRAAAARNRFHLVEPT